MRSVSARVGNVCRPSYLGVPRLGGRGEEGGGGGSGRLRSVGSAEFVPLPSAFLEGGERRGEEGGGGGGDKVRWMGSAAIVPMRSASVLCSHRCRQALSSHTTSQVPAGPVLAHVNTVNAFAGESQGEAEARTTAACASSEALPPVSSRERQAAA